MELIIIGLMILIGVFLGMITGLLPGIHINLIGILILSQIVFISKFFSLTQIIIIIIAMGITHTFLDFIPSIVFGIPDSETALSTLPSQRMILEGKGYEAIIFSATGSLVGVFSTLIFIPIIFFVIKNYYSLIKNSIIFILVSVVIILILTEKTLSKKLWATFIVLLSSGLGILTLNNIFVKEPLLVLFSGLFAFPAIIFALFSKTKFKKQEFKKIKIPLLNSLKLMPISFFSSFLCTVSPGIGNAQAATLSTIFFKNLNSKMYLIVTSSINSISFVISILVLYLIGKKRNGSMIIISNLQSSFSFSNIMFFIFIMLFVAIIGFFITIIIGKFILKKISNINLFYINIVLLIFLFSVIFFLTNWFSILILLTSISLGILTLNLNIRRVHLMSVLIIPIIFFIYL